MKIYVLDTWSEDRKQVEELLCKISVLEDCLERIYRLDTQSHYEYRGLSKVAALQALNSARKKVTRQEVTTRTEHEGTYNE